MLVNDHIAHGMLASAAARVSRRSRWVFGGFAVLAILLLGFEYRMHLSGLLGWLPYLILLACPLMHLFMHGDHGHGRHGGESGGGAEK